MINMKFSKQGEHELSIRDEADRELDFELKRIKMMKKFGRFKGRMIV
jgi:hypothetical protein